jgi:hypothetical protein
MNIFKVFLLAAFLSACVQVTVDGSQNTVTVTSTQMIPTMATVPVQVGPGSLPSIP